MSVNIFDANYYRSLYPDLAAAGLTTNQQLSDHLLNNGLNEGRAFSAFVDLNFYRSSNPDLAAAGLNNNRQAFEHLQSYGVSEGRRFSPFADVNHYLNAHSDLKQVFGNNRELAFNHLITSGVFEPRQFSISFDPLYYRLLYADINTVARQNNWNNVNLLEHFKGSGITEGRQSSPFLNVQYYLGNNSDLRAAGFDNRLAYNHFVLNGQQEGRVGTPLNEQWRRTPADSNAVDSASAVAVDRMGNIYTTGFTQGSLEGASAGNDDGWLAKYDSSGNRQWRRQFGTSVSDRSLNVAVDTTGNVYITGVTQGSLAGISAGDDDAWLAKYDSSGNSLWARQLGTSGEERSLGIAIDTTGNVYISGYTDGSLGGTNAGSFDAWFAKYDSSGNRVFTKQLGTSGLDTSSSIAVDSTGNVHIMGDTEGSLGGAHTGAFDSWFAKYDSSGNRLFTRQLGTSGLDLSGGVAIDIMGNVYVTGYTDSSLGGTYAGGAFDAWLAKYDSSGNRVWTRQLGTSGSDTSFDIAVDRAGNVYITGRTDGSLGGTNAGGYDAWLAQFNSNGTLMRTLQPGSSGDDDSSDIAVDHTGNLYIAGEFSFSSTDIDARLIKFSPV